MVDQLTALALSCMLKPSPEPSSSVLMSEQFIEHLASHDVSGSVIRVVDHDVRPGIEADMGDGDEWPVVREQILADGNPVAYGKVAIVGVVGNEDGAHKVTADLYQGLNDIGYTIPVQGGTYWNGEAMQGTDYLDLDETPEPTADAMKAAAANAAHLARVLRTDAYQA